MPPLHLNWAVVFTMRSNGSFKTFAANPTDSFASVHPPGARWPASSLIRSFTWKKLTAYGSWPLCTPNSGRATGGNDSGKTPCDLPGPQAEAEFSRLQVEHDWNEA